MLFGQCQGLSVLSASVFYPFSSPDGILKDPLFKEPYHSYGYGAE
jgi:hypothetical protein